MSMDIDGDTPSPKRRRTSSHGSAYSSRNSSPDATVPNHTSSRASPRQGTHELPLRRASLSRLPSGEGTNRRYSTSRSRENSPDAARSSDGAAGRQRYRERSSERN